MFDGRSPELVQKFISLAFRYPCWSVLLSSLSSVVEDFIALRSDFLPFPASSFNKFVCVSYSDILLMSTSQQTQAKVNGIKNCLKARQEKRDSV